MIASLMISLILTILIELNISIILGIREKEDIKVVILANLITNPVVVFCTNMIQRLNNNVIYYISVIIFEILAVITEFIIFKRLLKYKRKKTLLISIINNVISFSIGLVINCFI